MSKTGSAGLDKMKLTMTGFVHYDLPEAPNTTLVAITNVTTLTQEIAMTTFQVSYPVNALILMVDTTASLTGGTMALVGRNQDGVPTTELFTYTAAGTYTGEVAWSYLERIIFALTGAFTGAGDETCHVHTGTKFGLPVGQGGELMSVWKSSHACVIDAVGVYNRTYGTVIPASAPNADHTQQWWYTYKVPLPY
jgi:hypothetical protein